MGDEREAAKERVLTRLEELQLSTMLEEYRAMRAEIIMCLQARVAILSLGLAALGVLGGAVVAALRLSPAAAATLLVGAIPLLMVYTFWMWLAEVRRGRRAGAHLHGLEARVNALVGEGVLSWERRVQDRRDAMRIFDAHYYVTAAVFSAIASVSLGLGLPLAFPRNFAGAWDPWVVGFAAFVLLVDVSCRVAWKVSHLHERDPPQPRDPWVAAVLWVVGKLRDKPTQETPVGTEA